MKTLNKFVAFCVVAALAGLWPATAVLAEDISGRGPGSFEAYDKDGNGLISEAEFAAFRTERVQSKAAQGRPMRGVAGASSFAAFDSDGNGQLTAEELAAGQRDQMERRRASGMGRQGGMWQKGGMGKGMGRNMPAFSDYDQNLDGKLTEQEFSEARAMRAGERAQQGYRMKNLGNAPSFADIDKNGDGEVSADEFAAHRALQGRRPAQ